MLDPVEVAFYQLGMRITQCCILHKDCIGATPEDSYTPPGDWVVLVQHSIAALNVAFDRVADLVPSHTTLVDAGRALITNCSSLWERWSRLTRLELYEYRERSPFHDNIQRLKDLADRILTLLGSRGRADESWFALGLRVCDGYRDVHFVESLEWSLNHAGDGKLPPRRPPEWVWNERAEMEELLTMLDSSWDVLCPTISNEQATSLLPYDPNRYEIWFRVEAGLVGMIQGLLPFTAIGAESEATDKKSPRLATSMDEDMPPTVTVLAPVSSVTWKARHFDLEFDDDRHVVRRIGSEEEIELSHLNWYLLLQFEALDPRPVSQETLKLAWSKADLAVPEDRQRVDDALTDFRKVIQQVGLKTNLHRKLGWTLVSMDSSLLPSKKETSKGAFKKTRQK